MLLEMQHHRCRPVSDLDGSTSIRPFTRTEWAVSFVLAVLAVAPLIAAVVATHNADEARFQRQMEQDRQALRQAEAELKRVQRENAERRQRLEACLREVRR